MHWLQYFPSLASSHCPVVPHIGSTYHAASSISSCIRKLQTSCIAEELQPTNTTNSCSGCCTDGDCYSLVRNAHSCQHRPCSQKKGCSVLKISC